MSRAAQARARALVHPRIADVASPRDGVNLDAVRRAMHHHRPPAGPTDAGPASSDPPRSTPAGPPCRTPGCDRTDTDLYPSGRWCPDHSPAAVHGRTVPTPDPNSTAEALRNRTDYDPTSHAVTYGTLDRDPLGRTIPGDARSGFIPSRPCPRCRLPRREGHNGPHDTP